MGFFNFFFNKVNLLIIVLSIFMMVVVMNLPFKVKPFGDMDFHREAKNAALFIKGKESYDKVIISKAPGTVVFFTFAYLFAPIDATDSQLWYYGVFFNFLLVTISLLMIYKSATTLFSKEVGFFSILLAIIFPIHCYYAMSIIGETAAFFSFCLAIYGWSKICLDSDKKLGWGMMVVGVSFMILNRPNTLLVLPVGFLFLTYFCFRQKEFFKRYGKKIAISLMISGIIGYASLEAAKVITGSKFGYTQDGALNYVLFQGRYQFRTESTDFRFWDSANRSDSKDYQNWKKKFGELENYSASNNLASNFVFRSFAINDFLDNPFMSFKQFIVKCVYGQLYFINSIKPSDFRFGLINGAGGYWVITFIINIINLIVIFGVVMFFLSSKNSSNYWLLSSIIISLLLFHGVTYMEPRYMFPAKPAFFILGAAGLMQFKWINNKIQYFTKKVK